MMQQLLAAACAIGVAANFGTPFGGLLFSIEVTSTYYPIRNYYYAFLTALFGSLTYLWLWNLFMKQGMCSPIRCFNFSTELGATYIRDSQVGEFSAPLTTIWQFFVPVVVGALDFFFRCKQYPFSLTSSPLRLCALSPVTFRRVTPLCSCQIGIFGGFAGVLIIRGYSFLGHIRNKYVNFFLFRPFPYTLLVAIITSLLTFPGFVGPIISLPPRYFFPWFHVMLTLFKEVTERLFQPYI